MWVVKERQKSKVMARLLSWAQDRRPYPGAIHRRGQKVKGNRELATGPVEVVVPGEHQGHDTDVPALLLAGLALAVLGAARQNCGFTQEEARVQRGGATCLGSHTSLRVNPGLIAESPAFV